MYLTVHLLDDQVSYSWGLPAMPNKAASVGYQDGVVMIDEEEDQDVGVSAVVLCTLFNLSVMPCTSHYFNFMFDTI